MLIKCNVCGHEMSENAKACPKCGEDYTSKVFCKFCGNKIDKDAIVCIYCGKQVSTPTSQQAVVQINNTNTNTAPDSKSSHFSELVIAWIATVFGYPIGLGIVAGIYTIISLKRPYQGVLMILINLFMLPVIISMYS